MNLVGERSRFNGIKYENEVYQLIKNKDHTFTDLYNKLYNEVHLIGNKKVQGITNKKTTSKSDIVIDNKIGISVKMSNMGTQLQIVSLNNFIKYCEYNDVTINNDVIKVFKKFLGIIQPTISELNNFNTHRCDRNKNKKRYWLTELTTIEQLILLIFLKHNVKILLRFCLVDGMCVETQYKPSYFLINTNRYTDTNKIDFCLLSTEELINKYKGNVEITKLGNIQLNNNIGLQRKGSGPINSANCLQFKDRGFKNI